MALSQTDVISLHGEEHENEEVSSRMSSASSECTFPDSEISPRRSAFRTLVGAPLTMQQRLLAMLENERPQTFSSAAVEYCSTSTVDDKSSGKGLAKDAEYLERRRKNNKSARRSREVRRQREISNKQQVETLEKENVQLRAQIALLRLEVSQLSLVLLTEGVKSMS